MLLWTNEAADEALDLGDPLRAWSAFAEMARAAPGEDYPDLYGVPHAAEQEVGPDWLAAVAGQARDFLARHGDALAAGPRALLETLAGAAPEPFAEPPAGDDRLRRAALIAEILGGLYGDDALRLIDQVVDPEEVAGLEKHGEWRSIDHPRGAHGYFIAKNSPEALATAHGRVREVLAGDRTPEGLRKLTEHLSILTVKQLHELKRHYGLKASGRLKADLVKKIAERLPHAGEGEAPKGAEGAGAIPGRASALNADSLPGVWGAMKDELLANDPSLSPNRAGELAAARLRSQMGAALGDIDARARTGNITPEEERFYNAVYVDGWEYGRDLERLSGSRTMVGDVDHPYAKRPLDAPPLEDRDTPRREEGEKSRARAAAAEEGRTRAKAARAAKEKAHRDRERARAKEVDRQTKAAQWFVGQGVQRWRGTDAEAWARQKSEFVQASLAAGKPVPAEVLADYPDLAGKAPAAPAAPAAPLTDDQLAAAVHEAGLRLRDTFGQPYDPDSPSGRGQHKVFLSDLHEALKGRLGGMGLDDFKAKMLDLQQRGKVQLLRDDLANVSSPEGARKSAASEVRHPFADAQFHALNAAHEPPAAAPAPAALEADLRAANAPDPRTGLGPTIPDLYDRLKGKHPGLTEPAFHDFLRGLQAQDKATLQTWDTSVPLERSGHAAERFPRLGARGAAVGWVRLNPAPAPVAAPAPAGIAGAAAGRPGWSAPRRDRFGRTVLAHANGWQVEETPSGQLTVVNAQTREVRGTFRDPAEALASAESAGRFGTGQTTPEETVAALQSRQRKKGQAPRP
jgi:hypothetical protein